MSEPQDNPYETPAQPAPRLITSRQLIFGLIFGVVVLGGVISYQYARFRRLQDAAREAMMQAEAARAEAEKTLTEARRAQEELEQAQRRETASSQETQQQSAQQPNSGLVEQ